MDSFLPHYIEYDYEKPTSYDYTFRAFYGQIELPFHWRNIKYEDPELDISDCKFEFTNNYQQSYAAVGGDYTSRLKVDFPMLKEWKIEAD